MLAKITQWRRPISKHWSVDITEHNDIRLHYSEESPAGIYGTSFEFSVETSAQLRLLLGAAEIAASRDPRQLELVA